MGVEMSGSLGPGVRGQRAQARGHGLRQVFMNNAFSVCVSADSPSLTAALDLPSDF